MARGDGVGSVASVDAAAYMTIRPAMGVEWIIHNVYHEAEAEIEIVEGPNALKFGAHTEMGAWATFFFHLTNTQYLKVKNTNAGAKLIGYDGIISVG